MPSRAGGSGTINIATWNIRCGRREALHSTGRALESLNVDFAFIQETKITDGIYPSRTEGGYNVISTNGFSSSKGGVALMWRRREYFEVENQKEWNNNVMTAQIRAGQFKYYIVGCYLPPDDSALDIFEHVKEAWAACPKGFSPLLLGDLNLDVDFPKDNGRDNQIIKEVENKWGLDTTFEHFYRRGGKTIIGEWTWRQFREGKWHSRQIDYIMFLPKDRNKIKSTGRRLAGHHETDH